MHEKSNWKLDILEIYWIDIKNDYLNEVFYTERIKKLQKWKYFISDLDWTFFRWTLIKEAFSVFFKYYKSRNIINIDLDNYNKFLIDLKLFKQIENSAYNKKIPYGSYLDAWLFLIHKYSNQVNWQEYLNELKQFFHTKEKINPYRFSIKKIKEVLLNWDNFIFISWASNFVFDIYLDLLKEYILKDIWEEYAKHIYWFSSYANLEENYVYNLWNMEWKNLFIKQLKENWYLTEIIWWMWDTNGDFWISYHIKENDDFYFINPAKSVLNDFDKLAKKWVNYHFITERKDLIFEFQKENINILN